jgi:phosphomannomutase
MLLSSTEIQHSGIQFGTSGARGLVTQFTANACAAFTHAFIHCMKQQFQFSQVAIAIDNRPSSPAMAQACIKALEQCGIEAIYYGVVPTPALAFVSMQDKMPCIMVTGSHIPFDRNGLKFYRPDGEVSKADELAILNAQAQFDSVIALSEPVVNNKAAIDYVARYTSLFDSSLLRGKRVGIYEHSSAGRDLYADMFKRLGADVIALERSNEFVPIDTEAVSDEDKRKAKKWSAEYQLDFIFSTDGDGDRPLVSDEEGEWLRGDVLGLICANAMNIEALAVPVSCNTAIEKSQAFKYVERTKVGSPYVIAEFDTLANDYASVAGFEANGGFLLGTDASVNNQMIKALPTRDAVLPALMLLSAAKETTISALVNALPKRVTHSDRIQNFATAKSLQILANGKDSPQAFLNQLAFTDALIDSVDTTDGLRITFTCGDIVHFRPSGNAPELRCYAESESIEQARYLVNHALKNIQLMAVDL